MLNKEIVGETHASPDWLGCMADGSASGQRGGRGRRRLGQVPDLQRRSPLRWDEILGKVAQKHYEKDELI